jgi:hypothetical protein
MEKTVLKRLLIAALGAALSGAARAQEVVAVLASDQRAYRETYENFQAAFGKAVPLLAMGEEISDEAKVVLAFGGKAAVQRYPRRVTLIYAIAPGLFVDRKTHDGPSIKIMMEPAAGVLLGNLKAIQPGLKRLAVLWSSASRAASAAHLVKMGAARGVAVTAERLKNADELPSRLRELKGKTDALWLPPDPLLINAGNFDIIKHFSYDNDIPFYAPTDGLAAQGATAAVSVSYEEIGRMMAAAAKGALGGSASPNELYSDRVRVCVNRAAAAEAELPIPPETLKSADKVFP